MPLRREKLLIQCALLQNKFTFALLFKQPGRPGEGPAFFVLLHFMKRKDIEVTPHKIHQSVLYRK